MTFRQRRNLVGYMFLAPYMASFFAFIFLPVCVALWLAFVQLDLANKANSKFVGLQNFKDAVGDDGFKGALMATWHYTYLMVPSVLFIATGLGLGMFGMSRGREIARALIYIPAMLNVAATGILWQWFFNTEFGLFNFTSKRLHLPTVPWLSDEKFAMPAVVIMSLWWTIGGTAVIVLTGLQQIPKPFFEAAALDGASGRQILTKISFPLLKPVLGFVFVTTTIASFQMFGQAAVLSGDGPNFSTRGIVQYIFFIAFNGYRFGYGAAISWILFFIIAVFSLAQARFFRSRHDQD